MKNETPFEFPAWYINFQTAVLKQLPRPSEIDQVTALGWERNQNALKKNLAEALLPPPKPSNLKLKKHSILVLALTESFNPIEKFTGNNKVGYIIHEDFKKYLLNVTEPFNSLAKGSVDLSVLSRTASDTDIIAEIEVSTKNCRLVKQEILYRISYFTELQPNGETGILNNTGEATIISYFECDDEKIRVANVRWDSRSRKWYCRVDGLEEDRTVGYWVISQSGMLKY